MTQSISGGRGSEPWSARWDGPSPLAPGAPPASAPCEGEAPLAPAAVVGRGTPLDPRDVQVQRRLDAFLLAMKEPFRTPQGPSCASVPFRMAPGYSGQAQSIRRNLGALLAAASRALLSPVVLNRIEAGRGTPDEIHTLAQALIDGAPPFPADRHERDRAVRQLLFDHGIGIDCAGYVRQAASWATGTGGAGRGSPPALSDDLSGLGSRGFTRVTELRAVRPGDIVVLGPPGADPAEPGHRAIVYDQHEASPAELRLLVENGAAGQRLASGGRVLVFQVDSSWGCHGDAQIGGVSRETWWYCETTTKWGWQPQGAPGARRLLESDTPYGHGFDPPHGIFHDRARRP